MAGLPRITVFLTGSKKLYSPAGRLDASHLMSGPRYGQMNSLSSRSFVVKSPLCAPGRQDTPMPTEKLLRFLSVHRVCVVAKSDSRSRASTSYVGLAMLRRVYGVRCSGSLGECELGSEMSWFLRCSLALAKSAGSSAGGGPLVCIGKCRTVQ